MKKTLISLAVLAAATNVAYAQSNVTIYGTVDAGLVSERGGSAGTVNKVGSGIASASRLGFKGNEDLGSGLSAIFQVESGFNVDTGASDVAGSLFNRQAFVGLKSNTVGTLTLGRQYTPWYNTLSQVADPFAAGYAGSAKNLFPASNIRTSNTVLYVSPSVAGVTGEVSYSVGEQAGSNSAGREWGTAVAYANGPLNARLAYSVRNSDVTTTVPAVSSNLGRNILLAANYDFNVVKAFVAYGTDKGVNSSIMNNSTNAFGYAVAPKGSTDSTDALVGVTVPVGPAGTLMASYIRKNDKTDLNQDAQQWAVGYSYAMSKRTSAYTSFAKIKNKNGAGYTVGNNSEAGSGDKAFNVGIRHSF
ncbi:GBP family porin [Oxalobacteraceae bacterium GrIS 1.11]